MSNPKYLSGFTTLMLDWVPELNPGVDPSQITHGSHRSITWRCHKCGRIWNAQVKNRVMKTGCTCDARERSAAKRRENVIKRKGSLRQTQPHIAAMWHPTKNGDITPDMLTENSRFNAWWIDSSENIWQAPVWYICRMKGSYNLDKNAAEPGVNDLATKRPDLAAGWHEERNVGYDIRSIKPTAKLKVWWICHKGHEWQASVASRNQNKCNCPTCYKERNTSFPEQAVFFYVKQLFPDAINRYRLIDNLEVDVYIPSERIAIEYDGSYYHRSAAKKKTDERKNKLYKETGILLIRIIEEGGDIPPETEMSILCHRKNSEALIGDALEELFHFFSQRLGREIDIDINVQRDAQQIYNQYVFYEKENSIAIKTPDLLKDWHPTKNGKIKPEYIFANSNKILWWKCSVCGHEWRAPAYRRTRGGGCPACSGRTTVPGINDLATVRPDITAEWNYEKNGALQPKHYQENSNKQVWWKCKKCGYEWQALVCNRTRGRGCPKCVGKVLTSENTLEALNPNLASQWAYDLNNGLTPKDVMAGSNRKVWWRCEKGHTWKCAVSTRKRNNCPYCGNKILLTGYNDLATLYPELVGEWDYIKNELTTSQILSGSNKKVWWICEHGHSWEMQVSKRIRGEGCPYCKGKRTITGFNDIATTHPHLASEWHPEKNYPLLPTDVKAGSNKKVWWKCSLCGFEWETMIFVRAKGCGCPSCAKHK